MGVYIFPVVFPEPYEVVFFSQVSSKRLLYECGCEFHGGVGAVCEFSAYDGLELYDGFAVVCEYG